MRTPRRHVVAFLVALVLAPACGPSEDASPPPRPVKERPGDERSPVAPAPDPEVATVRSYLKERLRDKSFAHGLDVESLDKAAVSLHSATEKSAWVRAIRERASDDPALAGVDISTVRIASVYFGGAGGGAWLLVILDPKTRRPLTVVHMR